MAAIRKIKEASTGVALAIHGMMTETRIEDLPVLIVAWLWLPICFYAVKRSTARENAGLSGPDHLSEMHSFLTSISHRFGGARFVAQMMYEMRDYVAATTGEQSQSLIKRRMSSGSQASTGKSHAQEDLEADILDLATRFVDLKVAVNVVGR